MTVSTRELIFLVVLFGLITVPVSAQESPCPVSFSDATPLGDPIHTSRVILDDSPDCPQKPRVVATLYDGEESLASLTFSDEYRTDTTLVFPVTEQLPLGERAGTYQLHWVAFIGDQQAAELTQPFVVPCQPPKSISPVWSDADRRITVPLEDVDVCQLPIAVSATVTDPTGRSRVSSSEVMAETASAVPLLDLDGIIGERRYAGTVTLRSASGLSTDYPIEFVSGCGDLNPTVSLSSDRLSGQVVASDCQYPINVRVTARHESGSIVQEVEAVLMDPSFDVRLPEFDSWPAGDYQIQTRFIGTSTRAREDLSLTVRCTAPEVTRPSFVDVSIQPSLSFSVTNRDYCQSDQKLSVQVRDAQRLVVFNTLVDVPASQADYDAKFPFLGVPGSTYSVDLSLVYGLSGESQVDQDATLSLECQPPDVLQLGFSTPDATHLTALSALTPCNAPAVAKIYVKNSSGRVVVDADPRLLQDAGTAFARLEPVSLGHLDSGVYEATVTVADNQGRTSSSTVSFVRDIDGPDIGFESSGSEVDSSQFPRLSSLEQLTLRFSDSHSPMPPFTEEPELLPPTSLDAKLAITSVQGEATSQMWFTGVLDLDALPDDLGLLGVVTQDPNGAYWLAPLSRTYVPSDRNELQNYHPSRDRIGFRAIARVQPLVSGRHTIVGLKVSTASDQLTLIPASGSFNVTELSTQQPDALLRQGVSEIPVALTWTESSTALLERIHSVPDGDYTLSVVARDQFGNLSQVSTLTFRLDQAKQTASLNWPSIAGHSRVFTHRFRQPSSSSLSPLRVLYRRVDGFGAIRINGRNVTDQTTEDVLQPTPSGDFTIQVELVDQTVSGRFVLHADTTDAMPLELKVETFEPQIVSQRTRNLNQDRLTVRFGEQPCRNIVFEDLAEVSLNPDEVLCAVRLSDSGATVLSATDSVSEVRLPPGITTSALYEEGFVRSINGQSTFLATRQIPLSEMHAYAASPQIEFQSLPQWRNRASGKAELTDIGDRLAGHLIIKPGLDVPILHIDGKQIDLPDSITSNYRVPLRTNATQHGQTITLTAEAYYPETPDLKTVKTYQFVAVPPNVQVDAESGRFVVPGELEIKLRLKDVRGNYQPDYHGRYQLQAATVLRGTDETIPIPIAPQDISEHGGFSVSLPDLQPGRYRLQLKLQNTHDEYSEYLSHQTAESSFEVFDGSPILASVFTFRETDKAPFFGQLSLALEHQKRLDDIESVSWQYSSDGNAFETVFCCGQLIDFAISEPGVGFYRAQVKNRHSGGTSYTPARKLSAFLDGRLQVVGPRETFRGFPARYTVKDLPEGYQLLWRVRSPNADVAVESRSTSLEVPADETGIYYIEVVADVSADNPDSVSALRTFLTLETTWPRIPESVISGPSQLEFGKTATFTVTHPPIFTADGNDLIERVGEWELPDGSRIKNDEWTQFTLRDLTPGDSFAPVLYHTWLKGDPTTLTTAVHRVYPVAYRWPNWELKVATTSVQPPAVLRLSVSPEDWTQWMDLGSTPVDTHWDLPDYVRKIMQTPTEAIVLAVDDRPFDVSAKVTDSRGNITELSKTSIRPLKQIPFEISLSAKAERTLYTAPLTLTVTADPILLPKNRAITRVAFYVDGLYRGVSDGSPMDLQIRTPGTHEIRAIASIDNELTTDDTITLEIGPNLQARCSISSVGDFALNGLAKAQCDDPDGHMVEYRWFANGTRLSDTGTRVQLSRADRLSLSELSLVAVDNAGLETTARFVPPRSE